MRIPTPSWLHEALTSLHFTTFCATLAFFHLSEFTLAYVFMRDELSWRSWLISRDYVLALAAGVVEFLGEWWAWPHLKRSRIPWAIGVLSIVAGEALRKAGMLTARGNFTHAVRFRHQPSHRLVTHGVYAWERHPGYVGWLLWAVGTQLLLGNPLACVAFYCIATRFFRYVVCLTLLANYLTAFHQVASRSGGGAPDGLFWARVCGVQAAGADAVTRGGLMMTTALVFTH